MRVVLAGASGLIGTALRDSLLADGHEVTTLVRRAPQTVEEKQWSPHDGTLAAEAVASADSVVCLSGAGVADRRWTEGYKRTLRASRLEPVGTIARTLAEASYQGSFLSASAVGYYGDTGEQEIDESAPRGEGFLAELCADWEAAAAPAAEAGARVAQLRTGIVLTRRGGLLKRLLPIIKLGVGGRLGTGQQFLPWISLHDEVRAIRFIMDNEMYGPVNLTGPEPARNAELIAALAHLVHRPAAVPVPAFAIKLALGELAKDALGGQRAIPAELIDAGFEHDHKVLESALAWAVNI
jgi:uncharacterized protein (TIGR01777 family)